MLHMNKITIMRLTFSWLLLAVLFVAASPLYGQKAKNKSVVLTLAVKDQAGAPVAGALIYYNGGKQTLHTDAAGSAKLLTTTKDKIQFEALGYDEQTYVVVRDLGDRVVEIVMNNKLLSVAPYASAQATATIAADQIDGASVSLQSLLAGRIPGLYVQQTGGTAGAATAELRLRGNWAMKGNAPAVYVDGVLSGIDELDVQEIEEVTVLKDVSSALIYGPEAINGAILVTTKRGESGKSYINVDVQSGIDLAPKPLAYLDSYDYAQLYNEARANDGLSPLYSGDALDSYQFGTNAVRYPNNDYADLYMDRVALYNKATAQFAGGGDKLNYFVHLGYLNNGGFEKVGINSQYNRINLRSNLGVKFNDVVSAQINVGSSIQLTHTNSNDEQTIYGAMNSHRPNEYPIRFTDNDSEFKTQVYGASNLYSNNIGGLMSDCGYDRSEDRRIQANLALDFNLSDVTEGLYLQFGTNLSYLSYVSFGKHANFDAYLPVYGADGLTHLGRRVRTFNVESSQSTNWFDVSSSNKIYGKLGYERTFGAHVFDVFAMGAFNIEKLKGKTYEDNRRNVVATLGAKYAYANKVFAGIDVATYLTPAFDPSNNVGVFPSVNVAYLLSSESFLRNSKVVDLLKIYASTGVMGSDIALPNYLLHQDVWRKNSSVGFGDNGKNTYEVYKQAYAASHDLTFEKLLDVNAGVSLSMFKNSLMIDANYFYQYRHDMLTQRTSQYAAGSVVPYVNYGEQKTQGAELAITYAKRWTDWQLSATLNATYVNSKNGLVDEPQYDANSGRIQSGMVVDAIYGLQDLGLFETDADASNAPRQAFGAYQAGDIQYADRDGNKLIDEDDIQIIGNACPRYIMGLDLNASYKGIGLGVMLTSALDYDVLQNSSYYQVSGQDKYPAHLTNRWIPGSTTATYPRLSTQNAKNNFVQSTYWLERGDYLKVKQVALSYTFPSRLMDRARLNKARVYVSGSNLFAWSKIKDFDPEDMYGGLTHTPIVATFVLGVDVTF